MGHLKVGIPSVPGAEACAKTTGSYWVNSRASTSRALMVEPNVKSCVEKPVRIHFSGAQRGYDPLEQWRVSKRLLISPLRLCRLPRKSVGHRVPGCVLSDSAGFPSGYELSRSTGFPNEIVKPQGKDIQRESLGRGLLTLGVAAIYNRSNVPTVLEEY